MWNRRIIMATYIFECLKCRDREEHSLSMAEVSSSMKLMCYKCEIKTLQKQLITTAKPVHFKCTGWPDKG